MEQTKSAYQRVCEQECELCAKGIPRNESCFNHCIGPRIINNGHGIQNIFTLCTAPSKDAFMERQVAQIAAMQAALAQASHHRDCNTNGLICKNCDKWFREHGIATDACPDRDSVFEEVRGCCNCYLSTLSDDIERGKELLGQSTRIAELEAVVLRMASESHRQAVEIEELRKDRERLVWWLSATSKQMDMEDYLRGVREGWDITRWRQFIDAAMKEKS